MYFDTLNSEYGYESTENKQRINLSDRAYLRLLNDNRIFEKNDDDKITSALINRIFRNYRETAKASIAVALQNRRAELSRILSTMSSSVERTKVVDLLIKEKAEELMYNVNLLLNDKGNSMNIRLSKESIEYLVSDVGQQEADFYDNNVGAYLKAIIEEYTSLPYIEREKIYHKELIDEIKLAMIDRKLLKLELLTTNIQDGVIKHNLLYVKPYAIINDCESLYNYLVGYVSSQPGGPWNIQSVRLTSIKKCKKQGNTAAITKEQQKDIEILLREKGVQYLSSNNRENIVVEFTKEGEKRYQRMLHLRPVYISKDGLKYVFNCTVYQAEAYFFKFGHHAKILSPKTLTIKFSNQYEVAANQYKELLKTNNK